MKHFCSFSEAIRAGIEMRPNQAFHRYFRDEENATCAMGAGLEAIIERPLTEDDITATGLRRIVLDADMPKCFAYLKYTVAAPCGCSAPRGCTSHKTGEIETTLDINNLIVHLNNFHQWSREQIADWLESEEEKLGFVTLVESEPSALNVPEAGRGELVEATASSLRH